MVERNRTNLDEVLQVPVTGQMKQVVKTFADRESRRVGNMARVLIAEAIAARTLAAGNTRAAGNLAATSPAA